MCRKKFEHISQNHGRVKRFCEGCVRERWLQKRGEVNRKARERRKKEKELTVK